MMKAGLLLLGLLALADPAQATLCTLQWDAPTQNADGTPLTALAGYYAYQSVPGAPYPTAPSWIGDSTSVSCDLLGVKADGKTYTFVVKAYRTDMSVSGPSNEVSKTMPLLPPANGLRITSQSDTVLVIEGFGTCKSVETLTTGSTSTHPKRTLRCK